jgi:hypothetical protein
VPGSLLGGLLRELQEPASKGLKDCLLNCSCSLVYALAFLDPPLKACHRGYFPLLRSSASCTCIAQLGHISFSERLGKRPFAAEQQQDTACKHRICTLDLLVQNGFSSHPVELGFLPRQAPSPFLSAQVAQCHRACMARHKRTFVRQLVFTKDRRKISPVVTRKDQESVLQHLLLQQRSIRSGCTR